MNKPKRGRPFKDGVKKTSADYKTIHINLKDRQAETMVATEKGPTEFFNMLYDFWYQNFDLYQEQDQRKKEFLKRLKRTK